MSPRRQRALEIRVGPIIRPILSKRRRQRKEHRHAERNFADTGQYIEREAIGGFLIGARYFWRHLIAGMAIKDMSIFMQNQE